MLISRASHEAVVKAKDEHIAALKQEIAFLRHLVQPRASVTDSQVEADAVLEGRQDQIPADEQKAAIDSEAARILSGSY